MATRKVKDAKDLSTNELIYFKGHAKATYMSDGTTVEDTINSINPDLLVPITYSELKALHDDSKLVPGMQYRITDYTTTTQTNTKSANHQFDIIVTANDENTLSHLARAIQHTNDTYFANCNLSAWQIWYDINNDTTKYAWADETNGKGIIYRMIDEHNNDCPYDFKNILFYTNKYTSSTTVDNYYYTFSYFVNNILYDGTVEYQVKNCYNNIIKKYLKSNKQELNCNIFRNTSFGYNCHSNTFGYNCHSNTFGESCYSNTFGNCCHNNTFTGDCDSNTFGDSCHSNTFGFKCNSNTFGFNCYLNNFGDTCYSNNFGDTCYSNTFGYGCNNNTFGNSCHSNNFGKSFYLNTFGYGCHSNTFGFKCNSNTFGFNCYLNNFGDTCYSNTFEYSCTKNTFGNNCTSNTFEYSCYLNTFGNNCSSNIFGKNCNSITIKIVSDAINSYLQNFKFGNGITGEFTFTDDSLNRDFETKVVYNSNKEIVQYCEGDLIMVNIPNNNVTVTTDVNSISLTGNVETTENTITMNGDNIEINNDSNNNYNITIK